MLERARWHSLEKKTSHREFLESGHFAIVRHVEISYEAQALPGDDLVIRTGLGEIGNTSFKVQQEVKNTRNKVVCRAKVTYVAVGPDQRPIPVPETWRTMFSAWDEPS